jgi:hypothetical protein
MRVEIKEVNQRQEARLFSQFGNMLYADNPYYVPDMESDIMNMVNHRHNDSEAETIPFLAFRGDPSVSGKHLVRHIDKLVDPADVSIDRLAFKSGACLFFKVSDDVIYGHGTVFIKSIEMLHEKIIHEKDLELG